MTEDEKLAFVEAIADAHEDGYHRALAERTTKADPTFALEATEARGCCAHQQVGFTPVDHEGGLRSDAWRCKDCGAAFWPATALTAAEAHGEALRVERDEAVEELASNRRCNLFTWKEQATALQVRLTAVEQERDEMLGTPAARFLWIMEEFKARGLAEPSYRSDTTIEDRAFAELDRRLARLAAVEQERERGIFVIHFDRRTVHRLGQSCEACVDEKGA